MTKGLQKSTKKAKNCDKPSKKRTSANEKTEYKSLFGVLGKKFPKMIVSSILRRHRIQLAKQNLSIIAFPKASFRHRMF